MKRIQIVYISKRTYSFLKHFATFFYTALRFASCLLEFLIFFFRGAAHYLGKKGMIKGAGDNSNYRNSHNNESWTIFYRVKEEI